MSAWDHESADLFRAGRTAMSPSPADRERVRARLAAKLGAAAVGAAITTTTATTAAKASAGVAKGSGALATFAKIAAPIVLAGGAATLAAPHVMNSHAPPPVAAIAPAAPAAKAVDPAPASPANTNLTTATTATIAVDDLPPAKTAPVRPKRSAAPVPAAVDTSEAALDEARLVGRIDAALRDRDAARALRLADEHAQQYPHGVLVEEREGGRAIARCMSGSRASADAFLAAHPRSPMRGRIVAACGTKDGE